MSWLLFAFSGPILWALSTHLDKYLVERFFKESNTAVLLVFTALVGALLLPLIWTCEPRVVELPIASILLMLLSGLLYMTALFFYLRAIQTEEASVVAVFFQAAPLFGYVLGYLVLGETLSLTQTVGGILVILGALMASVRLDAPGTAFKGKLVALMLGCALTMSVSSLIFKLFSVRAEFWTTTFWMLAGQAIFGAGLFAIARLRRQLFTLFHRNPVALLSINGANELINLGGSLGSRYALTLAPLSLVQAVGATTTIFVFAFGIVLSLFAPSLARESLVGRELAAKGIAAVLVAFGVTLINR